MPTLSESEFDALFSKFYCLSYMIKYKHLYQFYKPLLRHYDKNDILEKLNYELYRLLFIATWDIHKRELHQKLYRFGIYRNYRYLQKVKRLHKLAIINNMYNTFQLDTKQLQFVAINCENGQLDCKNSGKQYLRIIL